MPPSRTVMVKNYSTLDGGRLIFTYHGSKSRTRRRPALLCECKSTRRLSTGPFHQEATEAHKSEISQLCSIQKYRESHTSGQNSPDCCGFPNPKVISATLARPGHLGWCCPSNRGSAGREPLGVIFAVVC